jgi:hypothetical protein
VCVYGTTGKDSPEEAIDDIAHFVGVCGSRAARRVHMRIRPAGTFRGEPPARTISIKGCDPDFGLTGDQRMGIRARLGNGPKAPRIDVVVEFAPV